jgi:hypothetical protein
MSAPAGLTEAQITRLVERAAASGGVPFERHVAWCALWQHANGANTRKPDAFYAHLAAAYQIAVYAGVRAPSVIIADHLNRAIAALEG